MPQLYARQANSPTTAIDSQLTTTADASARSASHTTRRFTIADVVVFSTFLAVPLAVSPALGDQFTGVKWYVLEFLAIVWVLVEVFARRTSPWPAFCRRHAPALIALAVLTVINGLRAGAGWAVEPLLARATFVALAYCAFAYFERNGIDTHAIRRALTAALVVVIAVGLAQVLGVTRSLGWEPLLGLTTGDGRSATFGNANMAAQFLGLALIFLLAHRTGQADRTARPRDWATDLLVAAGLAYLYLLGSRSAMLGLALALAVTAALTGRRRIRILLRPLALAAVVALPLVAFAAWHGGGTHPPLLGGADHPMKAQSLAIRLRLWPDTAKLIRDRPLGAGSGNFVHAFLPYQLRDERLRSEDVVYSSPHNEILRALAEEGILWCGLAGYLLIRLFVAVRLRARQEGWPPAAVVLAAGAAFLAVESVFQFPFSMAFGCLCAAVLVGLALSFVDTRAGDTGQTTAVVAHKWTAPRMLAAGAALLAVVALGRLVASDGLTSTAPRRACRLNARNLQACLTSAWLDARAGERNQARVRLAAVLDRSPYYHPAIKLLAEESLSGGDPRAGCYHLWIYDRLFGDRSSAHDRLSAECDPGLLESFRVHGDVPGYDRFPLTVPGAGREP